MPILGLAKFCSSTSRSGHSPTGFASSTSLWGVTPISWNGLIQKKRLTAVFPSLCKAAPLISSAACIEPRHEMHKAPGAITLRLSPRFATNPPFKLSDEICVAGFTVSETDREQRPPRHSALLQSRQRFAMERSSEEGRAVSDFKGRHFPLPSRRQVGQHDRFLSFPDADYVQILHLPVLCPSGTCPQPLLGESGGIGRR